MQRRDFITLIGGAAAMGATPVAPQAQQPGRLRLIGLLNILAEDDPESRLRIVGFKESLQELGWTEGANVRMEPRWAAGDDGLVRKYATELAALAPDVILASGSVT